jgi:hypothetical protein
MHRKILREPVDLLASHMRQQFARWLSSILPLQVGIHREKPFALVGAGVTVGEGHRDYDRDRESHRS